MNLCNKKKLKLRILILAGLLLFFIGTIHQEENAIENEEKYNNKDDLITENFNKPSKNYLEISKIIIDDASSNNWIDLKDKNAWCYGAGTFRMPYIIENLTVDVGGSSGGIEIYNSNAYFIIRNCTFKNAGDSEPAIYLQNTHNGTVYNNTIINYNNYNANGIYINQSNNNTIIDNRVIRNGIISSTGNGILLQNSNQTIISNNTIIKNGNDGIKLYDNCKNNSIRNNQIYDNYGSGLNLSQNVIYNNVTSNLVGNNSKNGIYLNNSRNNEFEKNIIQENAKEASSYGIKLNELCSDNLFFNNTFKENNGRNAKDDGINNFWNNSDIGNYWDDYEGVDINPEDGIGDAPHNIDGLANSNDSLPIWDDGYNGNNLTIDDLSSQDWDWASSYFWCSGSGKDDDPYRLSPSTINVMGLKKGLVIKNSKDHFIVEDWEIYNSTIGIKLENVSNGIINSNIIYKLNGSKGADGEVGQNGDKGEDTIGIYLKNSSDIILSNNIIKNITGGDGGNGGNGTADNPGCFGGFGATAVGIFIYDSHNITSTLNLISNLKGGNGGKGGDGGFEFMDNGNDGGTGGLGGISTGIFIDFAYECFNYHNEFFNFTGGKGGDGGNGSLCGISGGTKGHGGDGGDGGLASGFYINNSRDLLIQENTIYNLTGGLGGDGIDGLDEDANGWASDGGWAGHGGIGYGLFINLTIETNCTNDKIFQIFGGDGGLGGKGGTGTTHPDGQDHPNGFNFGSIGIFLHLVNSSKICSYDLSFESKTGIYLKECQNNFITDNFINESTRAVVVEDLSNGNIISDNTICNNSDSGIYMYYLSNLNLIYNNSLYSNKNGIRLVRNCDNNKIISNNISKNLEYGIQIYGWVSSCDYNNVTDNILYYNQLYGIHIKEDCGHNNIIRNNLSYNYDNAVYLEDNCDLNNFSQNFIRYNYEDGIELTTDCDENLFNENELKENQLNGIRVSSTTCNYNRFYNNTFLRNQNENAYDISVNNYWNESFIGNFWDNYTGLDRDFDLIGENYYFLPGSTSSIDFKPICYDNAPIHINEETASPVPHNWEWAITQDWCSGSGTYNNPYLIQNLEINGQGSTSCIIIENSNKYFKIENCTCYNSSDDSNDGGIKLSFAHNGTLLNNNGSNNKNGIVLYYSDNITVISNILYNNSQMGVYVIVGELSTISGNNITHNMGGIYVDGGTNNLISENNVYNNSYCGIGLTSADFNNNIIKNTIINNTRGIYCYDILNNSIINNIIKFSTIKGILLDRTINCTVFNNSLYDNYAEGVYLKESTNNSIFENKIINNKAYGIQVENDGEWNRFYSNQLIDNTINALDEGSYNSWFYLKLGNFWSNYSGKDDDDDGIGDNAYNWNGVLDNFPVFNDGFNGTTILIDDNEGNNWKWASTRIWCSGSGTKEEPYIIKDLIIDGKNSSVCIEIKNSFVYFIIKNCTFYNSSNEFFDAGIRLININNCTLTNNTSSFNNGNGICLFNSNNNTILDNTINNNSLNGIILYNSHNNSIIENKETINFNENCGIYLEKSNDNTISDNNINNNAFGIHLNESNYNLVSYNILLGNEKGIVQTNCIPNTNILLNNIDDSVPATGIIPSIAGADDDADKDKESMLPIETLIIIIIISIIISGIILAGMLIKRRSNKEISKLEVKKKILKSKEASIDIQKPDKRKIKSKEVKMGKVKEEKTYVSDYVLTAKQLEELKKTESEVGVRKKEFMCIVHKGQIDGPIYLCPNCHTLYCVRCAKVLKEKGEKCWSCEHDFEI